jgi:hypothetical protein
LPSARLWLSRPTIPKELVRDFRGGNLCPALVEKNRLYVLKALATIAVVDLQGLALRLVLRRCAALSRAPPDPADVRTHRS